MFYFVFLHLSWQQRVSQLDTSQPQVEQECRAALSWAGQQGPFLWLLDPSSPRPATCTMFGTGVGGGVDLAFFSFSVIEVEL